MRHDGAAAAPEVFQLFCPLAAGTPMTAVLRGKTPWSHGSKGDQTSSPEANSFSGRRRSSFDSEDSVGLQTSSKRSPKKSGRGGGLCSALSKRRGEKRSPGTGSLLRQQSADQPYGAAKLLRNLGETVTSVVISDDTKLFAAGAMNKTAIVCEVQTGTLICEFKADGQITATAIGGSGAQSRLIIGTMTGKLAVYHIHSNREEHTDATMSGHEITAMALAASSTRLAVGGKVSHILLCALSPSFTAGLSERRRSARLPLFHS